MNYGYAEKCEPHELVAPLFPDKLGGKPAWLDYEKLPDEDSLLCPHCSKRMSFLLQLYSPLDKFFCFHRFIYIFICLDGSCYKQKSKKLPIKALRCQLPRANKFFSFDPPEEELCVEKLLKNVQSNMAPNFFQNAKICSVCGMPSSKSCSNCLKEHYCCRDHQNFAWNSYHSKECKKMSDISESVLLSRFISPNNYVLPEFKLCSEPQSDEGDISSEEEEGEKDLNNVSPFLSGGEDEESEALEEIARHETKVDKTIEKLKGLIKKDPDHIIRFQREGSPFWLDEEVDLNNMKCKYCKGPVVFEFQILPTILTHLNIDTIDKRSPEFASIYIFTCKDSCDKSDSLKYLEEDVICQFI